MHIVHIATELAPIIKAGGLADVVHGLSAELARQGHTVKVIVPLYKFLNRKELNLKDLGEKFVIYEKNTWHNNQVFRKKIDDVEVIFIEAHHLEKYFNQENIYGYDNDTSRFIYFSRAALEFLLNEKKSIDILHLHDWHTSISALIAKDILKEHNLQIKAIVLTVHNFHYQGKCAAIDLDHIGLNGSKYLQKNLLQDPDPDFPLSINLLKGGIIYSDAFTTVSNTYAKELLQKKHTYGLSDVIQTSKKKLFGIMNGLDESQWDPANDSALCDHFSANDSAEEIKTKKAKNKLSLFKEIDLDDTKKPLFIFIGRLVKQKGVEILESAINHIIKHNGTFVLCGSAADPSIQEHFDSLKEKYKNLKSIHFHFDYNEALTRRMYASADFILVPSLFEPCGLVQLIAMRYGTIPIVRKTGGLNDSVEDIEINSGLQNGIVFEEFEKTAFTKALDRAFTLYYKSNMQSLVKRIMAIDFTWDASAKKYLNLYKKLCS